MSPQLRHQFIFTNAYHCPSCALSMHVDPHKLDSPVRILMCVTEQCEHFGFAWRIADVTLGVGVSDRVIERESA